MVFRLLPVVVWLDEVIDVKNVNPKNKNVKKRVFYEKNKNVKKVE